MLRSRYDREILVVGSLLTGLISGVSYGYFFWHKDFGIAHSLQLAALVFAGAYFEILFCLFAIAYAFQKDSPKIRVVK